MHFIWGFISGLISGFFANVIYDKYKQRRRKKKGDYIEYSSTKEYCTIEIGSADINQACSMAEKVAQINKTNNVNTQSYEIKTIR